MAEARCYPPAGPDLLAALQQNSLPALLQAGVDLQTFYVWSNPRSGEVHLRSLMQLAAYYAATEVLGALISLGCALNTRSHDDGSTALHSACSNASSGTAATIALLVQAGASKDVPNRAGKLPCDLLQLQVRPLQAAGQPSGIGRGPGGADLGPPARSRRPRRRHRPPHPGAAPPSWTASATRPTTSGCSALR